VTDSSGTSVGFVGLGNIGRPMALRLASQGVPLHVYDVVPEPVEELRAAGAGVAGSVAELARQVEVLCVMVRDDDQVREVLGEVLTAASPGLTVVVHSTVSPTTPAELADIAGRHGILLVHAPVSGGAMGAAEGTLAIMVGGSAEGYAACEKPFALMGTKVLHAGEAGAGTRMKLARNMLHFISFTAATEAQRLAEAAGLDLVELGNVVRHTDAITGGPGAIMHRPSTALLDPEDFWYGIFDHVRALGEKDLGFAVELAESLQVDVPLAREALVHLGTGLGVRSTS